MTISLKVWHVITGASPRRALLASLGVLSVPFIIGVVVLHGRAWHPVLDMAMTELRVRDVGGANTPLIGLPGRIGVFPEQGSHPGPLSFYLLAPMYRLAGSSAFGLLLGMAALNVVAIGLALWLAQRRAGNALLVSIAAMLAVLVRGFGLDVLLQPWNPYLPLLFWLVVLLATWAVIDGDHSVLVVVVAAASLCAQTHLPYLGLGLGIGALAFGATALTWYQHPSDRRQVSRSTVLALAVAALLWSPVVIDQFRRTPGNVRLLADYFRHPPEQSIGFGRAMSLLLRHLDVTKFVGFAGDGFLARAGYSSDGSVLPGLVLVTLWIAAVIVAVRNRHALLRSLHVVISASLLLTLVSMSRIFGKVWYYLTLWTWVTTVLMGATVLWTASSQWRRRIGATSGDRSAARLAIGLVVAFAGIGSMVVVDVEALDATAPEQHLSDTLATLVVPTVAALESGVGASTGSDGTYFVTWNDPHYFGSLGYGLLNELERRGFDVGVPNTYRVPATRSRVLDFADVTAEIRLATGPNIELLRAVPEAAEIARFDPRDAAELRRYMVLEDEVTVELTEAGLGELVPMLTANLFGLQLDPRVSAALQAKVDEMLRLGTLTAVFVFPPGVAP